MAPAKTKTNPLGAGRNPRAGVAATEKLTIRLTPEERKAYEDHAERAGISVGSWIRLACMDRVASESRSEVKAPATKRRGKAGAA